MENKRQFVRDFTDNLVFSRWGRWGEQTLVVDNGILVNSTKLTNALLRFVALNPKGVHPKGTSGDGVFPPNVNFKEKDVQFVPFGVLVYNQTHGRLISAVLKVTFSSDGVPQIELAPQLKAIMDGIRERYCFYKDDNTQYYMRFLTPPTDTESTLADALARMGDVEVWAHEHKVRIASVYFISAPVR
jgi:hypothetical protein